MPTHFPAVDRNHLISEAAKEVFFCKRPSTWNCDSRDGDNDYGLDYEVQLASGGQICHTFRVQLKGTESPVTSKDGTALSISLRRTTLNLYANTVEPVLLVVAVVELDEFEKPNHATSKVYWQWMDEELVRIRSSAYAVDESRQGSVAVHIPTANELTPGLDVREYLVKKVFKARLGETLSEITRNTAETTFGPLDEPLQLLVTRATDDPTSFKLFLSQDVGENESLHEGTPQFTISQAVAHLRAGKTALAEGVTRRLDRALFEATPKLKASLLSVEGKIAMQRMRKEDALHLFEEAYRLYPEEAHLLPREEMRFLNALETGDNEGIASIAQALAAAKTDDGLSLLLRVQVALSEFQAAAETLARINPLRKGLPELVLLSGQHRWADVESVAEGLLSQPESTLQDSVALRLLAARACWQQALAPTSPSPDESEIPLSGLPGLDTAAAERAWQYSSACLRGLKEFSWPPNVELLAPVAVACAASLGRQAEALPLLGEAAAERHEYLVLQENLELLAISAGAEAVALEANTRQPRTHEVLVRRAIMLFQARRYTECLATAKEVTSDLQITCKQTPMALATGYASAMKLARIDDAEQMMTALRANGAWGEEAHFATFAQQTTENYGNVKPLDALREGIRQFPSSRLLAANLYSNLRVDQPAEATEAISLARLLRQNSAFTLDECVHLIAAHITLEHWPEAETEAKSAVGLFGRTDRLVSLLAFAVEMQGKTGEALQLLEEAVSRGQTRLTTLHNYLGLCLRLGRMEAAQDTVEKLLEVESDRDGRLELLRLKALILAQQGQSDKALAVASSLGRLVHRDIETEEGMYLNLYMAVTLNCESVPENEKQAFWQRVEDFCAEWPESRLFRRVNLPERGLTSIDGIHDMLDALVGDSRRELREFLAREREARSGNLPIPFVARPGFVLHYIGDVFTLWDVAKRSKAEDRQFHLSSVAIGEPPITRSVLRDVPLLDLTALLILQDLGLFETLFSLFPRIAVPRSTIDYIAQNARGIMPSSVGSKSANELLKVVNDNLHRIEQPSLNRGGKVVSTRDLLNDYVGLVDTGRWATYTDDAYTRAWMEVAEERARPNHLCTADLLALADSEGLLPPTVVATHLSTLVSWNVGITVAHRYLIASLAGAVPEDSFQDATERLSRFQVHPPFTTLARAIWNDGKQPKYLVNHMGALLAVMLNEQKNNLDSVAAVWAFWVLRLKLHLHIQEEDLLCWPLLLALNDLLPQRAQRAVGTFLKVAEAVRGAEGMTRHAQKCVIGALGTKVGALAKKYPSIGEELRAKIAGSLVSGTEDGDAFDSAYLEERLALDAPADAKP